ncbi:hypothetical protein A1O7_06970 [Cladophialophora yegresii CBS 114405]|uniref:Zinc-binding loop region of homing endonuclease domain-containing protein n=1 Tax=Cladophialophora yegresii CBS 114405 TaxID=1182544 RepID=W9VWM1_9EURO|nr:uncharacterized protein A1O7_06970 [Cladophialophora yegresii CBS 114405]EXJ56626.1 hypothetical protein A1O7_06970 [Cladophialophora yegresii CBS 114405]
MSSDLRKVEDVGVHLDRETARLVDWAEHPPPVSRPYSSTLATRTYRGFTDEDDKALVSWVEAASAADVPRNKMYEEYSALKPDHSALAYESRMRVLQQRGLARPPTVPVRPDRPFPNLDQATATGLPAESRMARASPPEHFDYADFRMDVDQSIIKLLGLTDRAALEALLRQPGLITALREHESDSTTPLQKANSSRECLDQHEGRAPHAWKITAATQAIRTNSPRYVGASVDKAAWTADDHEIRFVVRAALDAAGQAPRRPRPPFDADGWLAQCTETFWLFNWIRFIHRPSGGESDTQSRLRLKKQYWLSHLSRSLQRVDSDDVCTPWHLAGCGQPDSPEPAIASDDLGTADLDPPTDTSSLRQMEPPPRTSPPATRRPIPRYSMPTSKDKRQQKGISWLTQEIRDVFERNLSRRLSGWGLRADRVSTCVLVPGEWKNTEPLEILRTFTPDRAPDSEQPDRRLTISIDDVEVSCARAVAWFQEESWPRRAVELDQFLVAQSKDAPWEEMQGSHLCHHGCCINPAHIVWEPKDKNLSRNVCITSARHLRRYGPVPGLCVQHDPPCLLQHASLTTLESLYIQLFVLSRANNLPVAGSRVQPPAGHRMPTFESQLPLQMPCRDGVWIRLDEQSLVGGQSPRSTSLPNPPFSVKCRFCSTLKRWVQVDAFWSHIKNKHDDVPHEQRLEEIRRSAMQYKQHPGQASMDYNTKQRVDQALASSFSWEVVSNWHLARDTVKTKR